MNINKLSLRTRIFIAMIFLVLLASVLIAAVTIYQYNEQEEDYHVKRLERKEEAIKAALIYELSRDTIKSFETLVLPSILDRKLNEISDIHNLDINEPVAMEKALNNITGVVTVGLFAMRPADVVLIGKEDGIVVE